MQSESPNNDLNDDFDVIVVGAGPIGLAAGISLKRARLSYLIIEKGCVCNSIYHYPRFMNFFTRAKDLEIGGYPFPCPFSNCKPSRAEALAYYRGVTAKEQLKIRLYEEISHIDGTGGNFRVGSIDSLGHSHIYQTKKIIIATGYFDNPNLLEIEGENDPQIASHYYTEGHPYFGMPVAVIGGGNSACEAAIDLYLHGANVHLIHRGNSIDPKVKYWLRPDVENRIQDGEIIGFMNTEVKAIRPNTLFLKTPDKEFSLKVSYTFILTGYHSDGKFLKSLNLKFDKEGIVELNSDTFESTRMGLYVIGSAGWGRITNKVFIENGRAHAAIAVQHIRGQLDT
ncbi:MAG: YpdA family putative bacillithiol disulfide reductase [Promethearchaeota archaeon]